MISNITYIPEKTFGFKNKFIGLSNFDFDTGPMSSSIFHIYEGLDVKASFSLELKIFSVYNKNKYLKFLGLYLKSHTIIPVRCRIKLFKSNLDDLDFKLSCEYIHTFKTNESRGKSDFLLVSNLNDLIVKVEGILIGDVKNDMIVKAEGQNEMIVKVERILSKKDIESFTVVSDEEAYSTVGDVQNEMISDKSRERSTIAKELSLLYSCSNIKGLETDISISFSACDETLHAHSLILMLRSPVFRAMLSNEYQESITKNINIEDIGFDMLSDRSQESIIKEIKIKDIGYECFKQILNYIYTDECELHENTFDLLNGSIKYGIKPLEKKIEDYLLDSISNENAAFCFYYSDLYRAESLKKNVLLYICRNSDCIKSKEFFKIIHSVQLQAEILKAVAQYYSKKL